MAFQNIILEKSEGITKLIINRPPVNVMDQATIEEIIGALEEVAAFGLDQSDVGPLIDSAGELGELVGEQIYNLAVELQGALRHLIVRMPHDGEAERALARPVRAHQGVCLSMPHRQGHTPQDRLALDGNV